MIATVRWHRRRIFVTSVGIGVAHCGASVRSIVRWANIVVSRSSKASTNDTSLGVLSICVMGGSWATSATEPLDAATRGVVVGWRWAEALLLLVVAADEELHKSGDEEKTTATCQ